MVQSEAWDAESVTDAISEAMSDVQDMDTGFGDYAKAAIRFLQKEGLLRLPQPGPVPDILHIAADHSRNLSIYACRGEHGVLGMAVRLSMYSAGGGADFGVWLSLSQARQLAAALTAQADAHEAAFPVEVAA